MTITLTPPPDTGASPPTIDAYFRGLLDWLDKLHDQANALIHDGNEKFKALRLAEQKKRHPRKRKNLPDLPQEVNQALIARFENSHLAPHRRLGDMQEAIREELCRIADHVTLTPLKTAYHAVMRDDSWSHHTQGWGAAKYARGSLLPEEYALKRHGFDTHVQKVLHPTPEWGKSCMDAKTEFVLWSNIEPWQFEAVKRTITITQAAQDMARHSVHPQVLMPLAYAHPAVNNPAWHNQPTDGIRIEL